MFDLGPDAIFRQRVLDLSGDVPIEEAQLIADECDQNDDDDPDTDGDAGEYGVATRDEASPPPRGRWLNAIRLGARRLAGVC